MLSRLLLVSLFAPSLTLPALTAAEPVDYRRDIKPILGSRCVSCHGALQQKAGLRLDASSLIRKGSKNGPVLTAGKSDESLLVDAVLGKDRTRMPPEKEGPALSEKQIALLRAWINQGAKMPDEAIPEDTRKHWAFQPPRQLVTEIRDPKAPIRNPIDSYLLVKQQAAGLNPRPEAGKETLLRRVTLDLTGLPPTREEIEAARNDKQDDWYEKVVDRLLQSPRHGERWARHWMDVWRYSDWYGRRGVPDVWNSAPQIHRWRDWIIASLNADRGYDRMLMEMLAGDELTPEDEGARDATGYLVRNWYALNPNQWMRDIVEHTGKAFLGLTFNCAHCHDHKYDPILQEDYFRLRAFFEPLGLRQDRVAHEADPGPFQKYDYSVLRKIVKTGAVRVFDENPAAKTLMYNMGDERDLKKDHPPVMPGVPRFLSRNGLTIEPVTLPASMWYPGSRADFRSEDLSRHETAVKSAETALVDARKATGKDAALAVKVAGAKLETAKAQLSALKARMAADEVKHDGAKGDGEALARAASKAERTANLRLAEQNLALADQVKAAAGSNAAAQVKAQQQEAAALKAVDAAKKALAAENTTYTPLSPLYPKTSTGRRKALALWIASKDNPLTARVAINHIWKLYFNRPIVETVADLGRNGALPSHPELLDWLACELMDSGWSMKHVHRLIVTSSAYRRQSGAGDAAEMARDPDNKLLWRFPSRRLEAEAVRDSVLFVAGQLDGAMGGPSLDNEADANSRRRSLYFSVYPEGGGHHRFLELFDPPDPCDCYKRSSSIVPQQALAMTNSRMLLDNSRLLARKLGEADFLRAAYEQVLSRSPTRRELELSEAFLRRQEELYRTAKAQPVASADASIPPSADPKMRARESLIRVLFNHDDFLTVR